MKRTIIFSLLLSSFALIGMGRKTTVKNETGEMIRLFHETSTHEEFVNVFIREGDSYDMVLEKEAGFQIHIPIFQGQLKRHLVYPDKTPNPIIVRKKIKRNGIFDFTVSQGKVTKIIPLKIIIPSQENKIS
jgi:hypothetical protein